MTPVYFCSICKDHTTGVLTGTVDLPGGRFSYVGCRSCYEDYEDLEAWIYQHWCHYITREDAWETVDADRMRQPRWAGPGFVIVRF